MDIFLNDMNFVGATNRQKNQIFICHPASNTPLIFIDPISSVDRPSVVAATGHRQNKRRARFRKQNHIATKTRPGSKKTEIESNVLLSLDIEFRSQKSHHWACIHWGALPRGPADVHLGIFTGSLTLWNIIPNLKQLSKIYRKCQNFNSLVSKPTERDKLVPQMDMHMDTNI